MTLLRFAQIVFALSVILYAWVSFYRPLPDSHAGYLEEKRELNDAWHGTPEMRAEDAARHAVEAEREDAR